MRRSGAATIVLTVLWLAGWVLAAIFILPAAALVVVVSLIGLAVRIVWDAPAVRALRARRASARLYAEACERSAAKRGANPDQRADAVMLHLTGRGFRPVPAIADGMHSVARQLFEQERLGVAPDAPPEGSGLLDQARYADEVTRWLVRSQDPETQRSVNVTVLKLMEAYCAALPPVAFASDRAIGEMTSVPLLELLPSPGQTVDHVARIFFSENLVSSGLFRDTRTRLDRNRHEMSGFSYSPFTEENRKLTPPTQHKGTKEEIVRGYLAGTPLADLFAVAVPFAIPQSVRFEHAWIVAGSGHGKTQTLQYFLGLDLDQVAAGQASVVLIDSQTETIQTISRLKIFAPGQPLYGRLCLIDPTDIAFPPALNLFDMGMGRLQQYSALDRERLLNSVLELFDYVFTALLSAELTQKQSIVFRFITRLLLEIPGATVHTFRELMEPKGPERFAPSIARLDGTARAFFETEFNSKQFEDTKRQVLRRLWGVLENRSFERMFAHPASKLDLFSEINSGKVILINAAKELLKQNGTELLGRFFIALIAQAAQERMTLPKEKRLPTFVYVDEAADYADNNVAVILEQARKANIGMVLAHQYVGQLTPKLQESFAANTSTKLAGGCSDKDARTFSHLLRCTPEFIEARQKGEFAAFVRNVLVAGVSLRIPFGHLENMERMTDAEFDRVRADMRARYAVPSDETSSANDCRAPEFKAAPIDPDAVDTAPRTGWS